MSTYRPQFEAALRLFARVSEAMVARGLARPVLVGGAAADIIGRSKLVARRLTPLPTAPILFQ